MELLREYVQNGSQTAFTAVVRRHLGLVYSVALRRVGQPQLAEEVAQAVFLVLARKAGGLSRGTILAGWLHRTARYAAGDALKRERRRQQREREAAQMSEPPEEPSWGRIAPLLDEALAGLSAKDRNLLLLRYFEQHALAEIGAALGIDPDTAQKRIARALDRLRVHFQRHGVRVSAAALAAGLTSSAIEAAPTHLLGTITAAASLAATSTVAATTTTLIKGTLQIMAWTKLKTALAAGIGILLAGGGATIAYRWADRSQISRVEDWQMGGISTAALQQAPKAFLLKPTALPRSGGGMVFGEGGRTLGLRMTARDLVGVAYGMTSGPRFALETELPSGEYDLLCNQPAGNKEALREALRSRLHLAARRELRELDVAFLKVKQSPAPGLRPNDSAAGGMSAGGGSLSMTGQPLRGLVGNLESWLGIPVLDRTGLEGRFDVRLRYGTTPEGRADPERLEPALLEQLGLELVRGREEVEVLVVEQAR